MRDSFGLEVTCTSQEGITAINNFIRSDIFYEDHQFQALVDFTASDTNTPLPHIYISIIKLYADTHAAARNSAASLEVVRNTPKNRRETLWFQTVEKWTSKQRAEAVDLLLQLTSEFPEDLVAARMGIVICLISGAQAQMKEFATNILSSEVNKTHDAALSFVSFALLENDELEQAETYVKESLRINPHNAWAQHNLAHIFATYNRFQDGIAALEGHQDDWKGKFIKAHVWWHLAIFYILEQRVDEAIEIYERVLIGMNWWHFLNQINILAFLLYIDLYDRDIVPLVGDTLKAHMTNPEKWGLDNLVDMMTVWCLTKLGDRETALRITETLPAEHVEVYQAGCSAMLSLAAGNREEAAGRLRPVVDQLIVFGGSNEQRKAFSDACLITRSKFTS